MSEAMQGLHSGGVAAASRHLLAIWQLGPAAATWALCRWCHDVGRVLSAGQGMSFAAADGRKLGAVTLMRREGVWALTARTAQGEPCSVEELGVDVVEVQVLQLVSAVTNRCASTAAALTARLDETRAAAELLVTALHMASHTAPHASTGSLSAL